MTEVKSSIDSDRIMQADEKWAAGNFKAELCFVASAWALHCYEALRTIIDWNSWVCCAPIFSTCKVIRIPDNWSIGIPT